MAVELNKREKEVLRLICFTTKEIAQKLNISPSTVATHKENIYNKLGIAMPKYQCNIAALVAVLKDGLMTLDEIERR